MYMYIVICIYQTKKKCNDIFPLRSSSTVQIQNVVIFLFLYPILIKFTTGVLEYLFFIDV